MLRVILTLGLLLASLHASSWERIIGGEEAGSGEFPWMVALASNGYSYDPYQSQFCGGSLIASQWVLTAAHCVVESRVTTDPNDIYIYYGSTTLDKTLGHQAEVSQIIPHEYYDAWTHDNDIALIKLKEPITSITPVTLPTSSQASSLEAAGNTITVSGWGDTNIDEQGTSWPSNLMKVSLPLVSNTTCASSYGSTITDNMICAGYSEGGKDSCQGDSGGPMFIQSGSGYIQLGVVSFGAGCAMPDAYGVYARVSRYLDWIESKTSGTGGITSPSSSSTSSSSTSSSSSSSSTSGYTTISMNQSISMSLAEDEFTYLLLNLDQDYHNVTIYSTGAVDTKVELYDTTGYVLAESDDGFIDSYYGDWSSLNFNFMIDPGTLVAGSYYLWIQNYGYYGDGENPGTFTVVVEGDSTSGTSSTSSTSSSSSLSDLSTLDDYKIQKSEIDALPSGWYLLGTSFGISDLDSIFGTDVQVLWHYNNGTWYQLTPQSSGSIPAKAGFWMKK